MTAATATLSGSAIRLENDPPNIGYWTSTTATASWNQTFPAPAPTPSRHGSRRRTAPPPSPSTPVRAAPPCR
ncbi:hypothetical protein [Streptomyces sp. NPDC002845]